MKALPIVTALMLARVCLADEIRTVGGREVNLQPLIDWLSNRQGERPLKHWKEVKIREWKKTLSSWQHCVIQVEGIEKEVLISNLPERIMIAFSTVALLEARVEALRAECQSAPAVPARDSIAARRKRPQAESAAGPSAAQLGNAQSALMTAKAKLDQVNPNVLAMFIGGTYGGLPVWDCGKPK